MSGRAVPYSAKAVIPHSGLSEQQEWFCKEYLIDLDPRAAAIRAQFPPSAASRLMKHPPVKVRLAQEMAARSARVGVNADRVLRELGKIAFGDPRSLFGPDGRLLAPGAINPDDAAMIVGVKTRRQVENIGGETVPVEIQEIRIIDKLSAINLAMKHLGMLTEKVDITVMTLAERIRAADARVNGGGAIPDAEIVEDTEDAPFLAAGFAPEIEGAPALSLDDLL